MPSTGDASKSGPSGGPAPLLTAVRQLAERDVYGLVWIGPDLVVDSIYGRMVDFVAIGEPITSSIYALIGMEVEIIALRDRPGDAIELPDITLVTPEGRRPRATLSVSWSPDDSSYILLVARTETRSDLELELTAQMRARLMAESELAAKTRELERANLDLEIANADLESYASVISHDLQSPMRVLRYTLDDLENSVPRDAVDAQTKINKLRDLSRRMTQMMSALLDYAGVTRKSDAVETVDTESLVRAIASSIDAPPGIHIAIAGSWPAVATMAAPLDLVLRNLIDNAVKHHDRETGTVTVSGFIEETALLMTIGDDGPGIPPAYQKAAFLPFRQLNSDRRTPGEGMGLALVRRTVETSGGRITLTSTAPESRGATFTVRWPVRHIKQNST